MTERTNPPIRYALRVKVEMVRLTDSCEHAALDDDWYEERQFDDAPSAVRWFNRISDAIDSGVQS